MSAQTAGQRIYLVRLARGDGVKRPEKLEDFAAALTASGASYDASTLSRMENGGRKVTIEDCEAIAPLDPRERGQAWIAFGDTQTPAASEETGGRFHAAKWVDVTAEAEAALAAEEEAQASETARRKNGGRKR